MELFYACSCIVYIPWMKVLLSMLKEESCNLTYRIKVKLKKHLIFIERSPDLET